MGDSRRCHLRNRAAVLVLLFSSALFAQTVRVPFVGCESSGQTGVLKAPKGISKPVRIAAHTAQELAHYEAANGLGVLAPRGWYCYGTSGSSGTDLLVLPRPMTRADWGGATSQAVQVEDLSGDTSGRFEVAQVIARVFPAHRTFVQNVIEMFPGVSNYKFGPCPNDKLLVQTDRLVQFQTPPHSEGLGTIRRLKANDDPIDGVAILEGQTPDLLMLRVRLPLKQRDLAPVIIQELLVRQRRDTR
jgi:hypothetical protein